MALRGTDLIILLDKSSSMLDVQDEVMRGFNDFLNQQRKNKEPAAVTLYQFGTGFETTYEEMDLQQAPLLDFQNYGPCGQTALYDGVGKAISKSEYRLNQLPDRPGKVLFVVITDGEENASKEYNEATVKKLVEEFKLKWQFVFLGADQDADYAASRIGIPQDAVMNYRNISGSIANAYKALADSVKRYREKELDKPEGNYFLSYERNQ